MRSKILLTSLSVFFVFCFFVLFKGLNNSNIYIPKNLNEIVLKQFSAKDLFSENRISSDDVFIDNDFYILNIWASWCLPCRQEHSELIKLSKNSSVKLIGLNYKDNRNNAKKFINELGNPYSIILVDKKGIISIELGAYGVPETFIINKNKKIVKKFIGPLNKKNIKEINEILK